MMDITRNQYFLAGLVLLFLGLQFRLVESFVLTPEFTQITNDFTVGAAPGFLPVLRPSLEFGADITGTTSSTDSIDLIKEDDTG